MGVQIDNYCTTSFILKDEEAVNYIKKLCNLLIDEDNLQMGYLTQDAYCDMVKYGNEPNSFIIKTGGYCDSYAELRWSTVHGPEDEELDESDYERDPVSLWDEIQKNLKEDTWFFVDGYGWDRSHAFTSVQFYHQDGRTKYTSDHDIKKKILQDMKL
jgi:hypothetical protein